MLPQTSVLSAGRQRSTTSWSIRSYLVLLVFAALVPVTIFSAWPVSVLVREERAAVRGGMKATARALVNAVDRELKSSITALRVLAASRHLKGEDLGAFYTEARRVTQEQHQWLTVVLATPSGRALFDTLKPLGASARVLIEGESFSRAVNSGEPAVGDLVHGPLVGEYLFPVRVPVFDDGKVKYVLTAAVAPLAMREVLADQKIPSDWGGSVVDGTNVIVAKTRDPELVGMPFASLIRGPVSQQEQGWVRAIGRDGVPSYVTSARSSTSGWSVALVVPAATIEGPLRRSLLLMVGIGFLFTLGGAAAASFFARRLSASIASVSAAAKVLGSGGAFGSAHPGPSGIAEVNDLADAIDRSAVMLDARSRERDELLAREQKARALAETAQQRFRNLVDSLEAIVWEADVTRLQFTFVSRRAEELLGFPVERWREPNFWLNHLVCAEDREDAIRHCCEPAAAGRDHAFEYRAQAADGRVVWLRDIVHVARDADGHPTQLRGVMVDITDRKRIEARLREESEAMGLVNQVGQIVSVELDQRKLIQTVTDAATRLTGAQIGAFSYNATGEDAESYTLYALSGASREDFPGWPDDTGLIGSAVRSEGVVRLDDIRHDGGDPAADHVTPPGHPPVRSYLAVPVVSRWGQVLGRLVFGHIRAGVFTERAERIAVGLAAQAAVALDNARLYEQAQRARVEAETASRTKDEFLAVLSHELRAPLNAIVLWTEVLRTGMRDPDTSARALETIERNTRLQAQLVDDLLDVSRIVNGKLRIDPHPVDLEPIITAAVAGASAAMSAKSLQLEVAAAPGVLVLGDSGRLQQIVANLLSNAIKFTPRGGRIEVRLARDGSQAQVCVSDSGKGISPTFLPRVFEYFRQADSTTTREHGGLGLGLAIVRRLVELHGGTVRAESQGEGLGARFTVELPLLSLVMMQGKKAAASSEGEDQEEPARALANLQVLLVEDDLDSRDALRVLLERRCGATVTAVASVKDALDALQRRRPDMLISDIGMPGEDGFTMIRKLRDLEAGSVERIPAVALTGYATLRDHERVLVAGYQAHLTKPVDPDELEKTVTQVMRARSWRTAGGHGGRVAGHA